MNPPRSPAARGRSARTASSLLLTLLLAASAAGPARAEDAPKEAPKQVAAGAASAAALWEKLGLPHYEVPATYSEDLVITAEGRTIVMKRAIDKGKTRTDLTMDGQNMIMIELGDERGTSYQLMPDRKEAVKESRASMDEMTGGKMSQAEAKGAKESKGDQAAPPDMKVEDLGDDAVGSQPARKMRLTSADGVVLAWFEKATGAPLRMESTVDGKNAVIEWKNRKSEPQPASLFEVPKEYKLHDMDEMAAQMKGMEGMGGMAKGMMSGMAQGMGSNLGGSLGAKLGGSLGGPLGAVAGQYIGGRIGRALGRKATGGGE